MEHHKEQNYLNVALQQLPHVIHRFCENLRAGDWIFLDGDLGAGKTTWTQYLSEYFQISKDKMISPTFSIMNEISLSKERFSKDFIRKIIHLDLYRARSVDDLLYLGLEEVFHPKNCLCLVEWPFQISEDDYEIFFEKTGCPKPNRIWLVEICLSEDSENRDYTISQIA